MAPKTATPDDTLANITETVNRSHFTYEFHHTQSPEIRWIRQTDVVALVAGAGVINLPDVPLGYHAYYYRIVVGGTGIGGATVGLFADGVIDTNLLDWGNVVAGGLGAVFVPSKPYQIDPGQNMTVNVTGAGAGEATINAYYRLVQHVEGKERVPLPSRTFLDEGSYDAPSQDIVDFYPHHSSEIPRTVPGGWQNPANAPEDAYKYGGPGEPNGEMVNS